MKRYILVLTVILSGIIANGQKLQEDAFAKANIHYNNGEYDSALIVYKKIIDDGYISPSLYYNIGNTYFKMRDIPMSIYYYERALKLDPNNEDIISNLSIANALTTDKIEPLPTFFLKKSWKRFSNIFTADEWAICSIVLLVLFLIFTYMYITARTKALKKGMFFSGILIGIIFTISIIVASQKSNYMKSHNEGIVVRPTITVKSSPSSSGVDLFVLHEGTKVEVSEDIEAPEDKVGWSKIKLADGNVGWLPQDALVRF